jgi:hypothetical protein
VGASPARRGVAGGGPAAVDPADAGDAGPLGARRSGPLRLGAEVGRGARGRLPAQRPGPADVPQRQGNDRELLGTARARRPDRAGGAGRRDRRAARRPARLRRAADPDARPPAIGAAGDRRAGQLLRVRPAAPRGPAAARRAVHRAPGSPDWAWTMGRSAPRRGTQAMRPACWQLPPRAACEALSAGRSPRGTTRGNGGSGSRSRTSISRKSSSPGGSRVRAPGPG